MITHTVVVKDALLASRPELAGDLFEAFAEAKRGYIGRLQQNRIEQPTPTDKVFTRVMEVTGDPLPYGVEPNRKVLEALVQRSVEQGIISRPFTVDGLFAAGTHALRA